MNEKMDEEGINPVPSLQQNMEVGGNQLDASLMDTSAESHSTVLNGDVSTIADKENIEETEGDSKDGKGGRTRSAPKYQDALNWFLELWKIWDIHGVKCCKDGCDFKLVVRNADENNCQAFLVTHVVSHMEKLPFRCSKCQETLTNKEEHLLSCEVQTPNEVEFLEANVIDFIGCLHECFPTLNLEDIEMFVTVLENPGSKRKAELYLKAAEKTLEAYMEVLIEKSEAEAYLTCLLPECPFKIHRKDVTEETMENHILDHFGRKVFFCRNCQVWVKHQSKHTEDVHAGRKDPSSLYMDLRACYQPSLIQLLSDCFRFPEEVIEGKTKGAPGLYLTHLNRVIGILEREVQSKNYFKCHDKECEKRFNGEPTAAVVENHVIRHLKLRVYTCKICNEKIKYLKQHFRNQHEMSNPGDEHFIDHRKKYQMRLISKLKQCFNVSDTVKVKAVRKPRVQGEKTAVGTLSNSDFSVNIGKAKEYLDLINELIRATKEKIREGHPPRCYFPGCELEWNSSYISSIERHIMRHSDRGFYECSRCGRCAKRMDDHIRAGACKRTPGDGQFFTDLRPEYEHVLIDLLKRCFVWYFDGK